MTVFNNEFVEFDDIYDDDEVDKFGAVEEVDEVGRRHQPQCLHR